MANFFKKLFGTKSEKDIKSVTPILNSVKKSYSEISAYTPDQLRAKTLQLRQHIKDGTQVYDEQIAAIQTEIDNTDNLDADKKQRLYEEIDKVNGNLKDKIKDLLDEVLPDAFAIMKATAKLFAENSEVTVTASEMDIKLSETHSNVRIEGDKAIYSNVWIAGGNPTTWNMVHYDVQLIGGIVLHQGKIAEMATGEGKTLVATLPVFLNALTGRGVHIVTVNDYLAKRDSEWMGVLYQFHGLTVDCIDKHDPNTAARRNAYNCDITFGTNNEFGFDYLRDNMTGEPQELVQREHVYAIVDEVDSVLIDDARTPLIISGPTAKSNDVQEEFNKYKPAVSKLYEVQRRLASKLLVDAKQYLTETATPEQKKYASIQLFRSYLALPKNRALIKFLSEAGNKKILQSTESAYLSLQKGNFFANDKDSDLGIYSFENDVSLKDEKINKQYGDFNKKFEEFKNAVFKETYLIPQLTTYISTLKNSEDVITLQNKEKDIENYKKDIENAKKSFENFKKFVISIDNDLETHLKYIVAGLGIDTEKFELCLGNFITINNYCLALNSFFNFDDTDIENLYKSKIASIKEFINSRETYKPFIAIINNLSQKAGDFKITGETKIEDFKDLEEIDYGTDGLYFVIDEKDNSIVITERGLQELTTDFNDIDANFFITPNVGEKVAEINEKPISEKDKEEQINNVKDDFYIKSERIHTVNQLLKAYALFEKDVEYVIIENKIKIVDEQTGRIMEGRRYSDGLHQALEAKENVKVEASTQTYATITLQNYFRMYEKLAGMTGTAETEAGEFWDIYKLEVVVIPTNKPIIRLDHEDLIYKTRKEKYKAVIDEIEKIIKEGRPVLVGTTSVEISELLSRLLQQKKIPHNVLNAKLHKKEADIVAEAGKRSVVTIATNMAGRGTDIKLSPEVKEAGGLAIIGTERHDSRRVDRQLRGRSGRQGDPGSSQFFVSLEDDLMRMFGSERVASIMDKLGLKEGEVIQHPMISKSIERAQKKVEENNFGIRKRLLEYDDVMNEQRKFIYEKRHHALMGDKLSIDISNMFRDSMEVLASSYNGTEEYHDFVSDFERITGMTNKCTKEEFVSSNSSQLVDNLYNAVYENYKAKCEAISNDVSPFIFHINETRPLVKNVIVPITDGRRIRQIIVNVERCIANPAREIPLSIEKNIVLGFIDDQWIVHLRELDDLKQSVQNAVYEQKDPLLMYKIDASKMFEEMVIKTNRDVVSYLLRCKLYNPNEENLQEAAKIESANRQKLKEQRVDLLSKAHTNTQQGETKTQPVHVEKKVGRNDPCPCGSGKKYKNCCGKLDNTGE
ncbi:MAG: SEC-C metal-binding domain-containing protein [Bacteroidales bacterium]|nr:SEC-C metal-binding domain-containing protein [Bacteroidales bacterium]MDD3913408.1 SEC-C metal-binding domain-containing protein [Bacteroidales bacterium]